MWSLSLPRVKKEDFDAMVDAAMPSGQPINDPGMADDVAAAKEALKVLGARVKRPFISASAGGHCLLKAEEKTSERDVISISVSGSLD